MTTLLGEEFFVRAADMGAISGDTSIGDLLTTWSVDTEAFLGWMGAYRTAVMAEDCTVDELVTLALLAGFETGVRARMAVEEMEKAPTPRRTTCSRCERPLRGYRGPLCRYCDGTAE